MLLVVVNMSYEVVSDLITRVNCDIQIIYLFKIKLTRKRKKRWEVIGAS